MKILLLLPLLLCSSAPVFSHNKANIERLNKGNCLNLVAHNAANTNVGGAAGCTGNCNPGSNCFDAFGTKYVCCKQETLNDTTCALIIKEMCKVECGR